MNQVFSGVRHAAITPWIAICIALSPAACLAQAPASSSASSPEIYHPIANPAAVIVVGSARFTVLTPQMIRMEWAADGKFEDHATFTFLNRQLPVPSFHAHTSGSGDRRKFIIDTDALLLSYLPGKSGDRFSASNLRIALKLDGRYIFWHPGLADTANLGGTARTLDGVQGSNVKLEPGLISRDGWTLVDDSTRPLFDSADFSMSAGEQSPWPWALPRPTSDHLDWYFFGYGHDYRKALGDYVQVAGRIPLPPRYAFGTWWSRYWAYSDQELNELVDGFQSRNIPLDVFVIDMDWHLAFHDREPDPSGHRKGWTGYTWNRDLFPDPALFLHNLHDRGLKVTLNLHPASGVQPFEEQYAAMATAMGQDPKQGKYVPFQITDRKYVDNYFKILHHPLEQQGIDFWWLDWQQEPTTAIAGVNPTFWLNYLHFTDQEREGKRPLLFHRWGGLGNHRYQIGFSGDVLSSWSSLAFQPTFTAQAANVGYAYWSHDIGGHIPGKVDPELYARWIQFGAFSPILRTHTTKNAEAERRVWAYPEPYSDTMADTMRLRYAWIPYIYTEARRTYDTGVAFLRPLYYDWPEQSEAYNSPNEYLFGDQVIAAPIASASDAATDVASESIWLPPGEWIEQPTGRHIQGPARATREFSLQQIPLYLRAGAIIPMQPPMLHTGEKPVDPLILSVQPLQNHQQTDYKLYEDSSEGRSYMTNQFATTALHATRNGSQLTVTIDAAQGSYPGMLQHRALQLELPADWPPVAVQVNGTELPYNPHPGKSGWSFEGNILTTKILTPSFDTSRTVTITITRNADWLKHSAELDGFPGKMAALRRAYDETSAQWPASDLIEAMQTGDRITYHPETSQPEVHILEHHERLALAALQADEAALPSSAMPGPPADHLRDQNARLAKGIYALQWALGELPAAAPQ
jgi:alpha-glucosidase (family GH31 glycosyl hydrolase)